VEGFLLRTSRRAAIREVRSKKVPKLAHLGYALCYEVGYKGKVPQGFLGATEGVRVLGAMAFVALAVLDSTVTVCAVFLMYVLGRRWM